MTGQSNLKDNRLLLGLVLAMAICPAMAMRWADWVPGLWVLQAVSAIGVLAGFMLARSRFSAGLAWLFSLTYGLFTIGLFAGLLLPPGMPWHERIPQLVTRLTDWFIKAAKVILDPDAADTSRDGMIFIMHTAGILWLFGYTAAWYTFRRLSIWRAILPSGILLIITHVNYYGPQPMGVVLVAFLFVALLYIVTSHYLVRESGWRENRVVYNRGMRLDFLQTGFLIILLVTPIAWAVPNVSTSTALQDAFKPLDSAWQRIQDGWTQLFASMKSYGGEYSDPFGNTLALGGPRQIAPRPVMDVLSNGGRYWRGKVYDLYNGEAWVSTAETRLSVSPDRPLDVTLYPRSKVITATFTSYLPDSGLLYSPHQPLRTDQQARFTVFGEVSGLYDIAAILSRYVIYEGKSYKTWGALSTADSDALRRAGTDYPDWVRDRYLQLPDDMSQRVADLAVELTAGAPTPYDQAEALTAWLRENITYNEMVEAPPIDTDPLEYVLFESRQGYCNYYASALAVMLRGLGVPARVASGYAQGSWQEELGVYRVYSNEAHAWTEVYFPGLGWLEFEPTSAQPSIVRTPASGDGQPGNTTETDSNLPEEGPELLDEDELLRQQMGDPDRPPLPEETEPLNVGLIVGGVVLLLALAAGAAVWIADWRSISGLGMVARVYDRMCSFARRLGIQLLPTQTPHERAAVLIAATPDAVAPIDVITDLYVEERFGQVREGQFDEQAVRAWQELRPAFWRRTFLRYLARFQRDGSEKPRLQV